MKFFIEKYMAFFSLLLLMLFSVAAISFSYQQNLWVDESTQLSGLTLSIVDMYYWLGGLIDNPFPVPSDRMPMLSYLLGSVWISVFGADVLALRYLSIVLVVSSLVILSLYFLKKQQAVVLLGALVFLCLSSNLLINAVEIRAYALFFALSLVAVLLYVDLVLTLERGDGVAVHVVLLSLVLMLAINTHFFGLVLSGALLGTYFLSGFFDRRFVLRWQYIAVVTVCLGVGIAFIVLPVLASITSQGGGKASVSIITPAIKLVYRLVAHQSMMGLFFLPYIALLLVYGVIVVSLVQRPTLMKLSLTLMLMLGFGAVFVANVFLSSFDALAPHYNIWMLPILAVLFGYCVADLIFPKQVMVLLGLVFSLGWGQYTLAVSGEKYAHTRFDQVELRVSEYRAQGAVGVLYNKAMAKTWFAGRYVFADSVNQYIATADGYTDLLTGAAITQSEIEASNTIMVVVYGVNVYSQQLAQSPSSHVLADDSPVHEQMRLLQPRWEVVNSGGYLAQESADIVVYKKTP
jgi:hypothetical protein